jgi:hypothetical protein
MFANKFNCGPSKDSKNDLNICPNYYSYSDNNSITKIPTLENITSLIDTQIDIFTANWVSERVSSCMQLPDDKSLYYNTVKNGAIKSFTDSKGDHWTTSDILATLPTLSCWYEPCLPGTTDVLKRSNLPECDNNCDNWTVVIDNSVVGGIITQDIPDNCNKTIDPTKENFAQKKLDINKIWVLLVIIIIFLCIIWITI